MRLFERIVGCGILVLAGGSACGGGSSKFPPRPSNCEVSLYQGTPSAAIENIGTVFADCDEEVGRDACEKTLKEQTCKLGGDVVWDVPEVPQRSGGKMRLSGHAAHTRDPSATTETGKKKRPAK